MKTNAESFLALVVQDADLRRQVLGLSMQENYDAIVAIAAEKGFPCTTEELNAAYRDGKLALPVDFDEEAELSDEQLSHVAGGGTTNDDKPEK